MPGSEDDPGPPVNVFGSAAFTDATDFATPASVSSAITTHSGATDPHGDRAYTTWSIATHAAATDPHGDRAYTDAAVAGVSAPDEVTLVTESSAAGVTLSTTPAEVASLALGTNLASGDVVDLLVVATIQNTTASPLSYTPVLRMNGNVVLTLPTTSVSASSTRTIRFVATILCTGSAAQSIYAELFNSVLTHVGPTAATATESQTTPTLSLYFTSSGSGATQTGTQVMAIARIIRA